jgi:hypothetical protein
MKPTIPIREALADAQLLGNVIGGESWQAWRVLLIAAIGRGPRRSGTRTIPKTHGPRG